MGPLLTSNGPKRYSGGTLRDSTGLRQHSMASNRRNRLPTEAIVIGYAMSRLSEQYLTHRGVATWLAAYEEAAKALSVPTPWSFKNLRDEFDPFHDNARRGWFRRSIRPNRLQVLNDWGERGDADLLDYVDGLLNKRTSGQEQAAPLNISNRFVTPDLSRDVVAPSNYSGSVANNELVLLDQLLIQRQAGRATPLRDDDAFELFACEQAMRSFELTPEEVAEGIIGGGNDGGIDGVYVFLGEDSPTLLAEDHEVLQTGYSPRRISSGIRLQLWLIQAKREISFKERAIEAVADTARRVLNLSEAEKDLLKLYSSELVTRTGYFRKALLNLAGCHPTAEIHFVYATRGRVSDIHTKVTIKGQDLERQFADVLPGAAGYTEFLGAAELWRRASAVPSFTSRLVYQESATSENSYVALVKLRDYLAFLSDDRGELRKDLFDWNVRDYQGNVEVNKEIRDSLQDPGSPEFWWLNNGVTVVCSKATPVSKTYSISDAQIVNGLQTSLTIHNVLHKAPANHPAMERSVLVRILITGEDVAVRDRVIRATNRQTAVDVASLRATDDIQRDIEAFFLKHDWYYDRRKSFYRNSGKSPERIVSITLLAQAVMAMGLSRPDNSRARPSTLLKSNEAYNRIFSEDVPLGVYLWLAAAQKTVDVFLQSEAAMTTPPERTNLRFHVAMIAAAKLVGQRVRAPGQLTPAIQTHPSIAEADLPACLHFVRDCLSQYRAQSGDADDKISKGPDFVELLLTQLT